MHSLSIHGNRRNAACAIPADSIVLFCIQDTTVDPQERSTWRSGVRSAMRAASQLPGKGPTDVDDAPAPACYQKSDYDYDDNI